MRYRLHIFFSIALLVILSAVETRAQNIDSLKLALKNAKSDTAQIKILSELSENCDEKDILLYAELCLKLCEKGISIQPALKPFYLKHLANAFNNIGFLADNHGDIPKALEYYHKSLKIREEIRDKSGIATSLNNIGGIYDNQGDIPKALEYHHKSLKIREEIQDKQGIAQSIINIGFIYNNQGDIPNALEFYHKSLKIQEEIQDKSGIATSLNNIGFIYNNQGDIPKALECYHKSLKIREEIMDKEGIATSLNNIGLIYNIQGDPSVTSSKEDALRAGIPKALEYYHKSLKIYEEIKDKSGIALSLNNIGAIYKKQGDIPKVLEYYHKSLKMREEIKDKMGIANSLNNIGDVLLQQGKVNEALVFAHRSMKTSKELGFPEQINRAAHILNKIYKKQNKFKDALEMYELQIQMRDSINNAETKKASIRKQFQYQYEKKAAADSVKNVEEQKVKNAQLTAQQAQLKQEKTQRFALYGGLVIIIIFLGIVFNRFRITQKQKILIEKQKAEVDNAFHLLHEKNKEVMDSIYYARRIQRALVTSEKYVEKHLNRLIGKK